MANHNGVPWLELASEADPCCTGRFHVTLSLCGSNNLKSEQWLEYLAESAVHKPSKKTQFRSYKTVIREDLELLSFDHYHVEGISHFKLKISSLQIQNDVRDV
ncbi:uncharacterized protein LOC111103537 [Crassostrea virginica]